MVSNVCLLFRSTAPCHTAAAPSSLALSPCPWWKRNQCPTRLRQGRPTTTGGLYRVTSGTWSACTFLDQEGMPGTPQQHRGATPVSSSTTSLEPSHSHTSRTEAGIMGAEGEPSGKGSRCRAGWTGDGVRCLGLQTGKSERHKMWRKKAFFPPAFSSLTVLTDVPAITDRHTSDDIMFIEFEMLFFYLFGATSVQINAPPPHHHYHHQTYRVESLPTTLQQQTSLHEGPQCRRGNIRSLCTY